MGKAVHHRPYGKGRITYIGAVLDANLITAAAEWMTKASADAPAFGTVPDGIEVSRRMGPNSTVFVLINFNPDKQTVPLPRPMKSLLDQQEVTQVELERYGVSLLLDPTKR